MRGVGAMLHDLSGGNKNSPEKYYGKTIASIEAGDDMLTIGFVDGLTIRITDNGQSCCEHRYIKVDDDLKELIGQKLVAIHEKPVNSEVKTDEDQDYDGDHEVVFLEIQGSVSSLSFSFHNEHNGYYGGFGLEIIELE